MKLYFSILEDWEDLTDEEVGILLRACLAYAKDGSVPSFAERHMMIAFRAQKRHIDEDRESYAELSEKRRESINKRWHTKDTNEYKCTQEKEKEKEKENPSKEGVIRRFTPPTLTEVVRYVTEAGLRMDAGAFFDHFTANGWRVSGKAPMKDWKAAVRSWARQESRFGKKAEHRPQTQYTNAELEKLEVDLGGGEFSW